MPFQGAGTEARRKGGSSETLRGNAPPRAGTSTAEDAETAEEGMVSERRECDVVAVLYAAPPCAGGAEVTRAGR